MPLDPARHDRLTPRQAAWIAAAGLLIMSVLSPLAFFGIFPRLIVISDTARTVHAIAAHQGLYLTGVGCYLITFLMDGVVAWALFVLLEPVHAWLSLLAAWLRAAYATMGLTMLLALVVVLRLVRSPDYGARFGAPLLEAQVQLLLGAFRQGWSFSLLVFALHLVLIAGLVWRSRFVPRWIGALLGITGVAYLVDTLRPYLIPGIALPYLFVAFFGELVFMLWLFVRGSRLELGGVHAFENDAR